MYHDMCICVLIFKSYICTSVLIIYIINLPNIDLKDEVQKILYLEALVLYS